MLSMFDRGTLGLTNGYLTWKIDNFYSLPLISGSEIRSQEFVYGYSRYTLVIWPRGQKGTGSEEWFGICLYKYGSRIINDSVQFCIATALGGTISSCTVECSEHNIYRQERFMEWSDVCALSHKIAPDGCLTILCKLPAQTKMERCIQKDNNNRVCPKNAVYPGECHTRPMDNPPVKYQSGEYRSPDPMTTTSLLKFGKPETQGSSIEISGINCSSPSTINSFYSGTSNENSFERMNESIEAQNPDLKISPNTQNTATGNTFWNSVTRGFYRSSKRTQQPEVVLDPVGDISEEATPESVRNSPATMILETVNSAKESSSSEADLRNSATASSNIVSSQTGRSNSNSSSQRVHPESESVGERDSQRTVQSSNFSPSMIRDYAANSTTNSCLEKRACCLSNQPGESPPSAVHYPKGLKILSEQMKNLYLEGKDFDLTILMEGKEFKVLRCMLRSRSPALAKLLSEDTSNVITINPFGNCDSSVFHYILLYIYSGEIENMSHKNVSGFYSAACKFELLHLKEECIQFLLSSLSIDTITDVLRSLDDSDSELRNVALIFFARNLEVIMFTDEWKQFTVEDPTRTIQYQFKALKIGYEKTIV